MRNHRWTPGPWVVPTGFYPTLYVGKDVSLIAADIICEVPCDRNQHGEKQPTANDFADALLIAAAPELYEALFACWQKLQTARDIGNAADDYALSQAEAALAKARGDHDDFPPIMKSFRDSLFSQADSESEVQS